MGDLITAGQDLTPAVLNQYYGYADSTQTTVTADSLSNLSTAYTIPENEPQAGTVYELECGGNGTWGSSSPPQLIFAFCLNGNAVGYNPSVAGAAFSASANFRWSAKARFVCTDGVQHWTGTLTVTLNQNANPVNPGTAADNSVALTDSSVTGINESVSSAITAAIQCNWAATTGSPTITNQWTTFKKVS